MDDLDLDSIRARAVAAGGADARWVLLDPVCANSPIVNQNSNVVMYDDGRPTREDLAHIAGMDPATTLALLDMIYELEHAPIEITAEMIEDGRVSVVEEIGDPECLSGYFLPENLAVAVYLAMLPASTQMMADEINRLFKILKRLGLGEKFPPIALPER